MLKFSSTILVVLLACPVAMADSAAEPAPAVGRALSQSGLIESRVGFIDGASGARVEAVEALAGEDRYRVLVSFPALKNGAKREIEEVLVTAPRLPDGEPLRAPSYEFARDYDNDRYGFYIYLDKRRKLPFRLYFKDTSSQLIQNTGP